MADYATKKPTLLPDEALLPRDDSGGLGFQPYTAEFGDGGKSVGDGIEVHDIDDSKKYLKRSPVGVRPDSGERKRRREVPRDNED